MSRKIKTLVSAAAALAALLFQLWRGFAPPAPAAPGEIPGGGLPAVTTLCVLFTGIVGAAFAPLLVKLFRLEAQPVAAGVAIGSASHAIGTGRAMEMGQVQGAMSSVAIGVAGILTTLLSLVW